MDNKFQFTSKDEKIELLTETKNEDTVDNKPKVEEKIPVDVSKRFYFSFEARIIVSIITIILLFAGACFLGLKVINHTAIRRIEFVENGDLNFQVCLKDSKCVSENTMYNSSEIDKIKLTFKYDTKYKEKIQNNSSYRIALVESKYIKSSHALLEQKDVELVKRTEFSNYSENYSVTENVTVDYVNYKELFDEDTEDEEAQIEVIFYLIEKNETRKISGLVIPLSKEKFELRKYTTATTTRDAKFRVNVWDEYSLIYGVAASILTIISLSLIYKTTKLVLKVSNNKNEYEDKLDSILKTYNSIITVAGEGFESIVPEEKEVVKFESIEELANMSKEIDKPIVYSKINNVKSEFVLEDDKKLYKYVIKEADFTEEDKNKLENK